MKNRRCFLLARLIATSLLLLSLASCGQQPEKQPEHTHKWEPANCSRGEFCFGCGETRGEALEHIWAPATCDKAKHCTLCGITEGEMLAHVSDGNGTCTVCRQALNVYVMLDGLDSKTKFYVYDGAVLRFPSANVEPEGRRPQSGVFGKEYWLYDQTGALVAQGTWDQRPCTHIFVDGKWIWNHYHDTEYIPLTPGTYRVEFDYYWQYRGDYEGIYPGQQFIIPSSYVMHGTNTVIVR